MNRLPHRPSAMLRAALLAALGSCAFAASAQVHKCVDASGKVVYSQSPCPASSKSATIQRAVPPAPPAPAAAAGDAAKGDAGKAAKSGPKTAAELEQEFRKRQKEKDDAAKKQQEELAQAKQKEENCRNARAQLAGLEAGGRQSRYNEKGERFFLGDEQIEQEKARVRQSIAKMCQ